MMEREEALRAIADARTSEIVITTMSAIKDWPRLSPSPDYSRRPNARRPLNC
jgi:hypothetical protein